MRAMTVIDPNLLCFAFANRIALILAGLIGRVVARSEALGAHAGPLALYLSRALARVQNLMGRLGQGLPNPAPRNCKGVKGGPRPVHRLPTRHGWLLEALGEDAVESRDRLQSLLAKPDVAVLLAAAPNTLRILRPICRMLGLPDPAPGVSSSPIPPPPRAEPVQAPRREPPAWDYRPSFHPLDIPHPPYLGEPV
jgi:hypothetical protein